MVIAKHTHKNMRKEAEISIWTDGVVFWKSSGKLKLCLQMRRNVEGKEKKQKGQGLVKLQNWGVKHEESPGEDTLR